MEASVAAIILKKYDTNNDGVIDEIEVVQIQADFASKAEGYELLQKYDTNGDGTLSTEELKQFHSDLSSLPKTERHSVPTSFAVGGHAGIGKVIRKPVNTCEGDFYNNIHKYVGNATRFFPEFFGLIQLPDSPAFIFMEDATAGCKKPAVLDIKIGKQTYLPNSKPEKIKNMGAKDAKTTSVTLGQRLTGYNYFTPDGKSNKVLKEATFSIATLDEYLFHLKQYFNDGKALRTDVIENCLPTLRELLAWKESSECTQSYYSSSILFVFDAANPERHGRAKLIDMANIMVTPQGETDENFNFGLKRLIELLENIVKEGPAYVTSNEAHHDHTCPSCGHKYSS
jgi:1D-myo-inositol-tetrakisphosphate 5-kinase/inositol-polyphosphate multikinase